MRIGFDVSKALAPDGIGTCTRQLLRALLELGGGDEIVLTGLLGPVDEPALRDLLADAPGGWRLLSPPATGDVDVLHSLTWSCPPGYRGPLVFTCHDLTFLTHPELHTLDNKLHCATGTLRAVLADATFVAVSRWTAGELQRCFGVPEERIRVVHHAAGPRFRPVDPDEARQRIRESFGVEGPFVLAVGTLEPRKNFERLLTAYGELPEALRRAHPLLLAGGGGWKNAALTARLAQPELAATVRRLGRVSEDDLIDLYSAAAVFAYPSLAEGFGLPVLEAMACGAPVLTSQGSALPEVTGDAARLVDPTDTGALGAALHELLESPEERQRLRRLGLARAATFSWRRAATETRDLYRSLAAA